MQGTIRASEACLVPEQLTRCLPPPLISRSPRRYARIWGNTRLNRRSSQWADLSHILEKTQPIRTHRMRQDSMAP